MSQLFTQLLVVSCMKTKGAVISLFWILLLSCSIYLGMAAKQSSRDSLNQNPSGAGIPNSGNTLQPNNGPEFPHSSFPIQSTDPGPLFHGPSGVMFDTIPDPQHINHPQ